jgi:hypothetical protein
MLITVAAGAGALRSCGGGRGTWHVACGVRQPEGGAKAMREHPRVAVPADVKRGKKEKKKLTSGAGASRSYGNGST